MSNPSLKNKYVDEITEAMFEKLADSSFTDLFQKEASLKKEAAGKYESMLVSDISKLKSGDYNDWVAIRNKYFGGGDTQTALVSELKTTYGNDLQADEKYDEYRDQVDSLKPQKADDQEVDNREVVAAEFTLKHLIKVADVLDANGFEVMAGVLDETIEKVAKKKR